MNATTPKRAVLTGVSRGPGRAMAEGFIARGHTVPGCARSADIGAGLRRDHPQPGIIPAGLGPKMLVEALTGPLPHLI